MDLDCHVFLFLHEIIIFSLMGVYRILFRFCFNSVYIPQMLFHPLYSHLSFNEWKQFHEDPQGFHLFLRLDVSLVSHRIVFRLTRSLCPVLDFRHGLLIDFPTMYPW